MKTNIPFQQQQPVFEKVGNIAELVRMTPEELKQYNISIDTYRTNLAVMKTERAEGYAEGLAEGLAKMESLAQNIALRLLSKGTPADEVASMTSLPIETVMKLCK